MTAKICSASTMTVLLLVTAGNLKQFLKYGLVILLAQKFVALVK